MPSAVDHRCLRPPLLFRHAFSVLACAIAGLDVAEGTPIKASYSLPHAAPNFAEFKLRVLFGFLPITTCHRRCTRAAWLKRSLDIPHSRRRWTSQSGAGMNAGEMSPKGSHERVPLSRSICKLHGARHKTCGAQTQSLENGVTLRGVRRCAHSHWLNGEWSHVLRLATGEHHPSLAVHTGEH